MSLPRIRFGISSLLVAVAAFALALMVWRTWIYPPGVSLNMLGPGDIEVEGHSFSRGELSEKMRTYAEGLQARGDTQVLRIHVDKGGGISPRDIDRVIEIGWESGFEEFSVDFYRRNSQWWEPLDWPP